jgi:hypothetical protein
MERNESFCRDCRLWREMDLGVLSLRCAAFRTFLAHELEIDNDMFGIGSSE